MHAAHILTWSELEKFKLEENSEYSKIHGICEDAVKSEER
jgi:hypothetical protein